MRSIASLKYTPNRNSRTLTSHNRALRIMSEREQDVQSQPSQRRAGIELLGDGHETYVVLLEETKHSGEVQQRSAQAVNFIHYDAIEFARFHRVEQPCQSRPIAYDGGLRS